MPLLFFSRRFLIFSTIIPFIASIALYRVDTFDPSHLPADALVYSTTSIPPLVNDQLLTGAEFIGVGLLNKPEDIAYDRDSGLIYTGCVDGWVKRVKVMESANDSVVENWVNTGGRPLGLAFGLHGEVIVADAYKGMFNISDDGRKTELLTDEAEGVRFKLTDAVAVGDNGVLYFTDASYKYDYSQSSFDVLEGKPHGRLMSFNPTTRTTRVLLKDLYFANGVSMSPDQTHLVFCETPCSVLFLNSIISSLCAFIESYHFKVVFLLLSEEDAASTTSVRSVLRYLFKAYRVIQITFGSNNVVEAVDEVSTLEESHSHGG
ncbi:hypothetical protein Bca101_087631 [Brassica carinata]